MHHFEGGGKETFFYQRCRGVKDEECSLLTIRPLSAPMHAGGAKQDKPPLPAPPRAHPPRPDLLNKESLVAFTIRPTMCFSFKLFKWDRHCFHLENGIPTNQCNHELIKLGIGRYCFVSLCKDSSFISAANK